MMVSVPRRYDVSGTSGTTVRGVDRSNSCNIRLVPAPKPTMTFHDFAEFERLVVAALPT
jgi:hypothetical protein